MQLVEANLQVALSRDGRRRSMSPAGDLPGRRALIVVRAEAFFEPEGVSTIPLSDGRAFLASTRPAASPPSSSRS
ncbi:MAG: hypothetical protein U0Q12_02290 [Vicinamibacterales bacterium]